MCPSVTIRSTTNGLDKNLAEAWTKVAATPLSIGAKAPRPRRPRIPVHPRVLAIWGTSDWLVDKAGNAWIAEVVNRVKPGNGKFVAMDSIDHFFLRTATPEESYRYFKPVKGMPPTEFNPVILETLCAWLDETAGRAKKGPRNAETGHGPGLWDWSMCSDAQVLRVPAAHFRRAGVEGSRDACSLIARSACRESDLDAFAELCGDPEVMALTSGVAEPLPPGTWPVENGDDALVIGPCGATAFGEWQSVRRAA